MNARIPLGMFVLLGCAQKAPPVVIEPRTTRYNEQEYAPYASQGTSSITGQAFLKTRGGDVKYGAGNEIVLTPRTSYSSEWWTKAVLQDHVLAPGDSLAEGFSGYTVADGEGRFRFDSLPAGEYFVITEVSWEVPAPSGRSYLLERTGALVGQGVAVRPGQSVQVILPQVRSIEKIPVPRSDSTKQTHKKSRRRGQP